MPAPPAQAGILNRRLEELVGVEAAATMDSFSVQDAIDDPATSSSPPEVRAKLQELLQILRALEAIDPQRARRVKERHKAQLEANKGAMVAEFNKANLRTRRQYRINHFWYHSGPPVTYFWASLSYLQLTMSNGRSSIDLPEKPTDEEQYWIDTRAASGFAPAWRETLEAVFVMRLDWPNSRVSHELPAPADSGWERGARVASTILEVGLVLSTAYSAIVVARLIVLATASGARAVGARLAVRAATRQAAAAQARLESQVLAAASRSAMSGSGAAATARMRAVPPRAAPGARALEGEQVAAANARRTATQERATERPIATSTPAPTSSPPRRTARNRLPAGTPKRGEEKQVADRLAEQILDDTAEAVINTPAFMNALEQGKYAIRDAGNIFHTVAKQQTRRLASSNQVPPGWKLEAEVDFGAGLGSSRLDVYVRSPTRAYVYDWKSSVMSGMEGRTRLGQMPKHARAVRASGAPLATQESRSWGPEVVRALRRAGRIEALSPRQRKSLSRWLDE